MKQWFMMDGRELDGRDIGVTCISSPHSRHVLEEIKRMIFKNNTTDTSLTDLIRLAKVDVLSDLDPIISTIEQKQQQQAQQKQQQEQEMQQAEQKHEADLAQAQRDNDNAQKQADRENKIEVAQIMIAPKVADAGKIEDTTGKLVHDGLVHNDKMDLERQKESNKTNLEQQKLQVQKQAQQVEDRRTAAMTHIAKTKPQPKTKK